MKQSTFKLKKETVADTVRNIKGTKSNFFSSTKMMKQTDHKVIKTYQIL